MFIQIHLKYILSYLSVQKITMLFSIHSPDTDDFLNRMQTCESLLVICHFCIKITSKKPQQLKDFWGLMV